MSSFANYSKQYLTIVGQSWGKAPTGLMVSVLDSRSSDPGSSPGQGTVLCSWAIHSTLMGRLSTQVY